MLFTARKLFFMSLFQIVPAGFQAVAEIDATLPF